MYRSLERLKALGLVTEIGAESGRSGPARTRVGCTDGGAQAFSEWLATPVEHVRDLRHMLILKLAFLARRGDSAQSLLESQARELEPIAEGLAGAHSAATGLERLVLDWRVENANAARRFVQRLLDAVRVP